VQAAGKARHIGITALGETAALRAVVDAGDFDAAQLPFNLLNPSAIGERPPGFSGHDFDGLMTEMTAAGMGVIGIRILAAGALSGEAARHPVAQPEVAPIGSGADYAADLAEARRLLPLVEEGFVCSLVEAAIRFAITAPNLATSLIGLASLEQLEIAIRAAERGPLPLEALERIGQLQG
jgi:L-galactose dehydrogenase/L-glyceraldehyde 3-phosphate reductase